MEVFLHWYLISGLEALSNADKSVSPVPRVLVLSGNAERDCELLREEAEAEWEILVEMAATEIRHRYAMELEAEGGGSEGNTSADWGSLGRDCLGRGPANLVDPADLGRVCTSADWGSLGRD